MYFLDYVDWPVDTLWPVVSPRKINWPHLTRKIRLTCGPSDPADQIDLWPVWASRPDWPVLRLTRLIRLTCDPSDPADQIDLWPVWPGGPDWPVTRLSQQIRLTCAPSDPADKTDLWPVWPGRSDWPVTLLTRQIRLTCDPSDPADQIDLWPVWPGRSDWPVTRLTRQIRLTCGRSVTAGVPVRSGRQSGPAPAARWTAAVPVDDQRPPAAASAAWSNTATTVSHSTSIAQMVISHFVHGAAKVLTCGQIYKLTFQVISIDPACGEEHNGVTIIPLNYVCNSEVIDEKRFPKTRNFDLWWPLVRTLLIWLPIWRHRLIT